MLKYSKFNTDRKGNQIALTVTEGIGYAVVAQAILYEGEGGLIFTMDNPSRFSAFFDCQNLADVVTVADERGWKYYTNDDSPLSTGEWK